MKRVFSIVMIFLVLLSAFGVVQNAKAAGTITYRGSQFVWGKGVVFIFDATGFKNRDLKGSVLFVHGGDYKLSCSVNKNEGKIVCVARGGLSKYAGETGVVTLAGRSFSVIIPGRGPMPQDPETPATLTCSGNLVLGADVTFFTNQESTETIFIAGDTLEEVETTATAMLGNYYISIQDIGALYCGEEPK